MLTLLAQTLPGAAWAEGTATAMSGSSCPDKGIATVLSQRLPSSGAARLLPHTRATAAVARVRAKRALSTARKLYTRTNFTGCIALLSISELELARSLGEPDPTLRQREHELLAKVALWIGICQWASGEPQAAAAAFVRSAQLPSSPQPDPKLLPPALVAAYRSAVARPRPQVTCQIDEPLQAEDVQVDGKGPTVANGDKIMVPAGSHYLVLRVRCRPEDTQCRARGGMLALRLEAASGRCRIQVPAVRAAPHLTCINPTEANDATFIAGVTGEARANQTLVVAVSGGGRVDLRLHKITSGESFDRQLVSNLAVGESAATVVGRSAALLVGGGTDPVTPPPPPPNGGRKPWYKKWWVWALAGTAAAIVVTTAVVAAGSGDDRVRVVFGP